MADDASLSLEELTALKAELKAKVKALTQAQAPDSEITPIYERYQDVSNRVKHWKEPAAAPPAVATSPAATPAPAAAATPAATEAPVDSGNESPYAGWTVDALKAEKKRLKGEIKALQSQSAPDDQIAPIFALYQLVGGFLADPSTIPPAAPSSAAPTAAAVAVAAAVATPVAAQPSTAPSTSTAPAPILESGGGGSGSSRAAAQPLLPEILSRGELEDRKKECKSTIKSLTASGAPDDQIKPVYDDYQQVKADIADYDAYKARMEAEIDAIRSANEAAANTAAVQVETATPVEADTAATADAPATATPGETGVNETGEAEDASAVVVLPTADGVAGSSMSDDPGEGGSEAPATTATSANDHSAALRRMASQTEVNVLGGAASGTSGGDGNAGDDAVLGAAVGLEDAFADDDEELGGVVGVDEFQISSESSGDPDEVQRVGELMVKEAGIFGDKWKKRTVSLTNTQLRIHKGKDENTPVITAVALRSAYIKVRKSSAKANEFDVLSGRNLRNTVALAADSREETQEWAKALWAIVFDLQVRVQKQLRFAAPPDGFTGMVLNMGWVDVRQIHDSRTVWVWKYLVLCDYCLNLYDRMPETADELDENEPGKVELVGARIRVVTNPKEAHAIGRKRAFTIDSGIGPLYVCVTMTAFELSRWQIWLESVQRKALYIRTRSPILYRGSIVRADAPAEGEEPADGTNLGEGLLVLTRNSITISVGKQGATAGAVAPTTSGMATYNPDDYETLSRHTFGSLKSYLALAAVDASSVSSGLELNFGDHVLRVITPQGAVALHTLHSLIMETHRRRTQAMDKLRASRSAEKLGESTQ